MYILLVICSDMFPSCAIAEVLPLLQCTWLTACDLEKSLNFDTTVKKNYRLCMLSDSYVNFSNCWSDRGHSKSSISVLFDRLHMVSYLSSIVTTPLSCRPTVSKILSLNYQNLNTPHPSPQPSLLLRPCFQLMHRVKWHHIPVVAMRSPFCRSTRTVCS